MYLKVKTEKSPEEAWMIVEAHNIGWTFRPRAHWIDMVCPQGCTETWVYGGMKEGDGGNLGSVDLSTYPPPEGPQKTCERGEIGCTSASSLMFAGIFFKDDKGASKAVYTNLDAYVLNDAGKTIERIC